jgi:hypothetical protein
MTAQQQCSALQDEAQRRDASGLPIMCPLRGDTQTCVWRSGGGAKTKLNAALRMPIDAQCIERSRAFSLEADLTEISAGHRILATGVSSKRFRKTL